MTDRFTDRLSEYIDGELAESDEALVRRHLEDCAECAGTLADLEAVRRRAADLVDRSPDRDLWEGIAERIAETGGARPVIATTTVERRFRRIALTVPQLAAAAVIVAAVSTTGAWMALDGRGSSVASIDGDPAAPNGTELVSNQTDGSDTPLTDRYGSVISELEAALFDSGEPLPPETEAKLRRALLKIDRAIEDAVRALDELPGDPYLEDHVETTMRRKADFLRRAVRLSQS